MYKKSRCLTVIILVLGLAGIAFAYNDFTDDGGDNRWDNPANWSMGLVPNDSTTWPGNVIPPWYTDVYMTRDGTLCVIDDTYVGVNAATAYGTQVGAEGGENTLHILGGELILGGLGFNIGRGAKDDWPKAGYGHVLMTGGTVTTAWLQVPEQWTNGSTLRMRGELIMTGGEITTG